jgi:transcription-repair coupling factor (superfamily II helicase)
MRTKTDVVVQIWRNPGMSQSLIAQLASVLFSSKELETATAKLETGRDATIGIPLSARPLLVAAAYAANPRPVLVVVSGEEAAYLFARDLSVWLGNEAVLQLPLKTDIPWRDEARVSKHIQEVGQRARAICALASGEARVVVASARALLRCVPPLVEGVRGTVEGKGSRGTGLVLPLSKRGST